MEFFLQTMPEIYHETWPYVLLFWIRYRVVISVPGIHTGLTRLPFYGWHQALEDFFQKHQKIICA